MGFTGVRERVLPDGAVGHRIEPGADASVPLPVMLVSQNPIATGYQIETLWYSGGGGVMPTAWGRITPNWYIPTTLGGEPFYHVGDGLFQNPPDGYYFRYGEIPYDRALSGTGLAWGTTLPDGGQYALFRFWHPTNTPPLPVRTKGNIDCVGERKSYGDTAAQADLWCQWGRFDGSGNVSAPIKVWRRQTPDGTDRTTFAWGPEGEFITPTTRAAFSQNLLARWTGHTSEPTSRPASEIPNEIRFLIPLGAPAGGETKDHIFLNPTIGALRAAATAGGGWHETLGFDCPLVLWEDDSTALALSDADLTLRHGAVAVERCRFYRARCDVTSPPADCASYATYITPNESWQPVNRVYLNAPGEMVLLGQAASQEEASLPGATAQILEYRLDFRFGAAQVTRLDHLNHLTFTTTSRPAGRFLAGQSIGFAYRIPPSWASIPGTSQNYGQSFDWGVYDYLGTGNVFANPARYDEQMSAFPPAGLEFLTKYLAARCPYEFYDTSVPSGLYAIFNLQRGHHTFGVAAPFDTPSCHMAANSTSDPFVPAPFPRRLSDIRGGLQGQWYRVTAWGAGGNPGPNRGRPELAVATGGTGIATISIGTTPPLGTCPSSPIMGAPAMICMDMASIPSGRMPDQFMPTETDRGVCYRSVGVSMGVTVPVEHVRFVFHSGRAPYYDLLSVFRGSGACPADLQTMSVVGGETFVGDFMR